MAGDLPAVLERAAAAGVHGGILAGYGPERWGAQAELARRHPSWRPCFGLHPWRLAEPGDPFEMLEGLPAFLEEAVGLGELGLDRSPRLAEVSWDLQVAVFRAQLALARERDLPVVLHLVRAPGAAREILHRDGLPRAGGMVHAFTAPREVARTWLDLGLHLSFGALRGRAAESAREVPGHRLLVETDAPDGAPEGPAALPRFAAALADLRGEPAGEVLARSEENLRRLFRLPRRASNPVAETRP